MTKTKLSLALKPAIIAIDGPAASGKSTIGYQLAQLTDFLFFDTGIMYRAITWAALKTALGVDNPELLGVLAEQTHIDIKPPLPTETDGRQCTVLVMDEDVTWQLRTPEVDQNVSVVAANSAVRHALTGQQRRIGLYYGSGEAEKPGIIIVGRDIGTIVMPDAPLKIYMIASDEERARRRYLEQQERGKQVEFIQVLADLHQRDKQDSERDMAPLRPAEDAITLDTSGLSPEQVIVEILQLAQSKVVV